MMDNSKWLQQEKDTEISPLLAECSWKGIEDGWEDNFLELKGCFLDLGKHTTVNLGE